jgi:PAS domain S-box-containing protein
MVIRTHISKSEFGSHQEEIEFLKMGFDTLQDHAVVTDENANILYANKAAESATGFSVAEMLGKNPADLWGGNMPKDFYEAMWHTIKEEKQSFTGEVRNRRKDRTEYWQEIHILPITDNVGNVKFFLGIEPKISDRKELEQFREGFLLATAGEAEDSGAAVRWTLEWLSKRGKLTGAQRKALEEFYRENRYIAFLISDLLFAVSLPKKE